MAFAAEPPGHRQLAIRIAGMSALNYGVSSRNGTFSVWHLSKKVMDEAEHSYWHQGLLISWIDLYSQEELGSDIPETP